MYALSEKDKQEIKQRHADHLAGKIHCPTLDEVQNQFDSGEINKERFEWLCYLWNLRPQDKERNIAECLDFASIPGF